MKGSTKLLNRTKITVLVSTLLLIVLSVLGITYAYFSIQVTGNEETSSVIVQTAILRLVYTDTLVMEGRDIYPGWNKTKTITVENTGTVTVAYNIVWRDLLNTITSDELVMSATCVSNVQGNTCQNISEMVIPTSINETHNVAIKSNISIEPGELHTYIVSVTFKEMSNDQNYNQGKMFRGTLNISEGVVSQVTNSKFFEYSIENNEVTLSYYKESAATSVTYDIDINTCLERLEDFGDALTSEESQAFCNGTGKYPDTNETLGDWIGTNLIEEDEYNDWGLSNVNIVVENAPTDVIIPSMIDGYPVTEIGDHLFALRGITSIVIPNTVTTIGDAAFLINNLTSVEIPDSVTLLGESAFAENNLSSIKLSSAMTTISDSTFKENNLSVITIPSNITSIGYNAFQDNQITSITIQGNNVSLGLCSFGFNPPLPSEYLSNYVCN